MGFLTKVENILNIPMEKFHQGNDFHPIDLCRLAVRCLEQGCKKGLRRTYAPNTFHIYLHSNDYNELYPFLKVISSDIQAELERHIEERKYVLASNLEVFLFESTKVKPKRPEIKGLVCCESEPDTVLSSTVLEESMERDTILSCAKQEQESQSTVQAGVNEYLDEPLTIVCDYEGESVAPEVESTMPAEAGLQINSASLLTNIPGVLFQIMQNGDVCLENCLGYKKVTVDGEVCERMLLRDGSVVKIGPFEMTYSTF
ncbi:FhaA domain-containing protein [Desulfotalea psychrophila]|uniref:FhaA N-terminal domain-containing protein n=1 Tax=Desulfotalea psychrophila (strain LSv54 / DSM 12343) TaxID=177439 RepID=Q6AKG4_DESPS|nr:FhaA domain-containing protein [Desulfotalea psychrophila]CAG37161.1 unknown protein [Desulfotalea psychrophila LSv54]